MSALLYMEADGLAELIAGLKASSQGLGREQRKANKRVAEEVSEWARSAARSGTRQQVRAAGAIKPRSTQSTARLAISGGPGYAKAAFWGMSRRTGWYAAERYRDSQARQAPPWVGNSWTAGVAGQGPHVINDAIAAHVDEVEALYAAGYESALKAAFPGGFE